MNKTSLTLKRLMAIALAALMTFSMTGCDTLGALAPRDAVVTAAPPDQAASGEQGMAEADFQSASADADASEAPTPLPDVTPVPTPSPTPVPVVAIADYKYQKLSNKTLNVSFTYPSHWINVPGSITISYVEPVDEGNVAARVAVSVKKASKVPDAAALKSQLEKLIDSVSGSFSDFKRGSASKKLKFMGSAAYSVVYEASMDGQSVKGFMIITYRKSKKRLVALHFYAPADRYDDFSPVLKQIRDSVKLT